MGVGVKSRHHHVPCLGLAPTQREWGGGGVNSHLSPGPKAFIHPESSQASHHDLPVEGKRASCGLSTHECAS